MVRIPASVGANASIPVPRARCRLRYTSTNPLDTKNRNSTGSRRAFNAGLRGREAFNQMNGGDLNADLGSIFVVGMGLNSSGKERTNHLAWESSNLKQSALFGDDRVGLKNALRNALAKIGVPDTDVTLGSPVVGSVKELIPEADPSLSASDVLASSVSDFEVRTRRASLRNNVLFTTSVSTPGFRGRLKA